ncbi:hypothetical protein MHYP_G00341190 [Metynnis hypsauchen]
MRHVVALAARQKFVVSDGEKIPTNTDLLAGCGRCKNRLLGNKGSKWTATRNGASPERICLRHTESKGDAYGNLQFLIYKDIFVRRAIMTDGEGREHFHFLESEEARVPIAALYGDEEGKGGSAWSPVSESAEARAAGAREPAPDLLSEEEEQPYPKHAAVVFFCFKQTTRPRSWCLRMVCNPYPFCPRRVLRVTVGLLDYGKNGNRDYFGQY